MKNFLKRIIPHTFWEFARTRRAWLIDFVMNAGATICRRRYQGFILYYNRGNALIDRVRRERYFEQELCEHIIKDISHSLNKNFVDVGANIGLITLSILSSLPEITVHAFEPGPLQAELLEKTIIKNELSDHVKLHRKALGASAGTEKFFVHDNADIAKDGFKNTLRGEHSHEITVSVNTLDNWWRVAGKPHVAVVKIDTEGAELFVLQGGKEFFSAAKPILYLEIEPSNLVAYPYTADDVIRFLNSIEYDVSTLDGMTISPDNINEFTKKYDTYRAFPRVLS